MSKRPSRAKMCNWLSGELLTLRVMPVNPADIEALARNARTADQKLRRLASIASELGWNVDADLDTAATLIREYEGHFLADTDEPKAGWVCSKCAREAVRGYDDGQIPEHHRTCPKRVTDTDERNER